MPLPADHAPPPDVTPALFTAWRSPRHGTHNPTRLTNPVWAWLARHPEITAWQANQHFRGPSALTAGPGWCASRFGQSETELPDGRVVLVGGEHEDHYDPDFTIYNDVVVRDPSGGLEIFGYPTDVFPPTDFHSSTLVDGRLVVIGCLGYPERREPGRTPVFALDTATLAFTAIETHGALPGWIHRHQATLEDGRIVVRGGSRTIAVDDRQEGRDNHDDWALDLERRAWTRLTERRWPVFELRHEDGSHNDLFWIEIATFHVGRDRDVDRQRLAELEQRLGFLPDFERFAARYAPPLAPHRVPAEYPATQIVVDGVTVRYAESLDAVRITIEGDLGPSGLAALVDDARSKLERVERTPWVARRLDP